MRGLGALNRFFFAHYDGRICGLYRIATGSLMLLWALANGPNWERDYGNDGILGFGPAGSRAGPEFWYSIIHRTDTWIPTEAWWYVLLALSLSYILGWKTKLCAVALFLLHSSILFRNLWTSNAEQTMFRMQLFYALFLPVGRYLSLDATSAKKAGGHPAPLPATEHWGRRMVQLNCCLIYLFGSYYKWTSDVAWQDGDLIYYAMMHEQWAKWPWPGFFYHAWTTRAATWGSFVLESSFPLLCWLSGTRAAITTLLIAFHCVATLTLDHVGFFSMSMACTLVLFYEWRDLERIVISAQRARLRFFPQAG